jgi:hypothetical protein
MTKITVFRSDAGHIMCSPAPPPGFDPGAATGRELAKYGYPRPRAKPISNTAWHKRLFRPGMEFVMPTVSVSAARSRRISAARSRRGGAALSIDGDWSGSVVDDLEANQQRCVEANGTWTVPPTELQPMHNGAFHAVWVGIDGENTNNVFQAGTMNTLSNVVVGISTSFRTWIEWWPKTWVFIDSFHIHPGDVFNCLLRGNLDFEAIFLSQLVPFLDAGGTWLLGNFHKNKPADLVLVQDTPSAAGKIVLAIATGSSNYADTAPPIETGFASGQHGVWQLVDFFGSGKPDLVLIKTSATASNTVEINVASASSNYQTIKFQSTTTFALEQDGVWSLVDQEGHGQVDLAFIKTSNTTNGKVEVHIASKSSKYQKRVVEDETRFLTTQSGSWILVPYQKGDKPDLFFIQSDATSSGQVEVSIASGKSKFLNLLGDPIDTTTVNDPFVTAFPAGIGGTWLLTDFDGDGFMDLVNVRSSDDDRRRAEIEMASGSPGKSGFITLINETTNKWTSFDLHAASGTRNRLKGVTVEWILERPVPDTGGRLPVPNFDFVLFTDATATLNDGSTVTPSDGHLDAIKVGKSVVSTPSFAPANALLLRYTGPKNYYQTRQFDGASGFALEQDGTWFLARTHGLKVPDLVFVKTANTGSGMVEVHIASAASAFMTISHNATMFNLGLQGTWLMADFDHDDALDLVLIQTAGTTSGNVEVVVASGVSGFTQQIFQQVTSFQAEADGVWTLIDKGKKAIPDLAFIKTANTPSGNVEVHFATGASGYQQRYGEMATIFKIDPNSLWSFGDFNGKDGLDLFRLVPNNTATGQAEIHIASAKSEYQTLVLELPTGFPAGPDNGTWMMTHFETDKVSDLALISTAGTASGKVEVHVISGQSSTGDAPPP